MNSIIGISPLQFLHVLDLNTNVMRVEVGPQTVVLNSNEKLVAGPLPMIVVPPVHYCVIQDPMVKYVPGKVCELKLGQIDVKFHGEPFCLYPGETLRDAPNFVTKGQPYEDAIKPLPVIKANSALRLEAILDHVDESGIKRNAGDKWQLDGPLMYHPSPNAEILKIVEPVILAEGMALKLRARQDFKDRTGRLRVTGEEWIIVRPGAYVPGVCEEVVKREKKKTLQPNTCLRLRADRTLVDSLGKKRLAGEEWLLTGEEKDEYYMEIGVEVLAQDKKVVLKQGQHCIIKNPVDKAGKPQLGKLELRVGCCSFYLHPGEEMKKGIMSNYILAEDETIVLMAQDDFTEVTDKGKVKRKCGERWMVYGPLEYVPPIEVKIIKKRKQIPLSKNEGVYVQDIQSGKVRAEMGPQSYMLKAYEELWEKELAPMVEDLLRQGGGSGSGDIRKMAYFEQSIDPQMLKGRDKTRVITYRCPGNTAVQVSNYLDKTARVVFGPDLVILQPHENFNILHLSAGKPKVAGAMKSLCLMLGPDFISDILDVETSDHARLRCQIAFNNHFEYTRGDKESEASIFSVPDFIGFACRQIGSMIRAAVALIPFDVFHRHSAQVIQEAVFRDSSTGEMMPELQFKSNNLVISGVDVQSIEPVDVKMRDSLSKSVQLAIEIATSSIEAAAQHEALRNEQVAEGQLERQRVLNEKEAERERCKLLELRAVTAAVESTGQATAEAQAQAERILIECESEIEGARLKAEAEEIEDLAKLDAQTKLRSGELSYLRSQNKLELQKSRGMADIEVKKFKNMVDAIGADTLAAISRSGPETQAKMLKSLGLETMLITDGNSPINLFNTASGLVKGAAQ